MWISPLSDKFIVAGPDWQLVNLRRIGKVGPRHVGEELVNGVTLRELSRHVLPCPRIEGQSGKGQGDHSWQDEDAAGEGREKVRGVRGRGEREGEGGEGRGFEGEMRRKTKG